MAEAGKLPDIEVLLKLRRQGMTYDEMAEQLGCSAWAINRMFLLYTKEPRRASHKELLPWKLPPEARDSKMAKTLRNLSRMQQGLEVTPYWQSTVKRMLEYLAEENAVVVFDGEHFRYRPRAEEDGHSVIRPGIWEDAATS